jgi:hypothetical protein
MVKKVGGTSRSSGTSGAAPIQATKTVESAKVGSVEQVRGAERKEGVKSTGSSIRALTPEQQEQIFQLIDEEADKMFADSGVPAKKKEQVKDAVKMAIEAGIIRDETEK